MALVFVDFALPSHGYPGVIASEAGHCASEQDSFWEMHDTMFERQEELLELDPEQEAPTIDALVGMGEAIGLDGDALRTCLEEQKYRPIIGGLFRSAVDDGLSSTPTLLVGQSPVVGFVTMAELEPIIEKEISRALGTPVPTDEPAEPEE